jgi:uncharacterized protein YkwD
MAKVMGTSAQTRWGKVLCSTFVAFALANLGCSGASRAATLDDAILEELNFARLHPQEYARLLQLQPASSWDLARSAHGDKDPEAFAQAIAFLMRQAPLPPLHADENLAAAAREHVAAQGPAGDVGHDSRAGERFDDRLRRHGVRAATLAENIAYGPSKASDVVRELIIDSGVPNRGHRRNIFYETFDAAGVSCGPHRDYAAMCVIDFASLRDEAGGRRQTDLASNARTADGGISRLPSGR